jgi:hypothetical protein
MLRDRILHCAGIVCCCVVQTGSFPSKAVQVKKNKLSDLQAAVAAMKEKERTKAQELEAARGERQQTKERKLKMEQLTALKKRKREAEEELSKYDVCDPQRLAKLSHNTATAQRHCRRPHAALKY